MPRAEGPSRSTRPGHAARRGSSAEHRAQWAETYDATPYEDLPWFDAGPSRALVDAVESGFLPAAASVLDIGCGAGSNVLWLAGRGYEVHGIDISPGAVRATRRRVEEAHLPVEVLEGDALALPFPSGRFDAVLDHGCFHTLPVSRRAEYAAEVARVLRGDGHYLLCWVAREHAEPFGPPHRPSLNEVAQAFEDRFVFARTEFHPGSEQTGLPAYAAWLIRRTAPEPLPR